MSQTSLERVLTTLGHKEPDRVPMFLLLSLQGAIELKKSIKDYYADADCVTEGQLLLKKKYSNDCYYAFYYAPIEIEAYGGDIVYYSDGPINSGAPIIRSPKDIKNLKQPIIEEAKGLQKVLTTIRSLKKEAGETTPIIGVVMSPFSLPVMQMGFERYLDLIYDNPKSFEKLMSINQEFCVEWANAQLDAGATAICYFDPVSSTSIIPPDLYRKTGFVIAKQTISRIKGPTATHLASGRCLKIAEDLCNTGTYCIATSVDEDLEDVKKAFQNKLTVIGNLNGIEMCRWTKAEAEKQVKEAIFKAAAGGGFILSDNHGEIPYNVPSKIIMSISDAVQKWGNYPINKSLNVR